MKTLLHYSLLATILFGFQPFEASSNELSETPVAIERSSTNYQFDQRTGVMTLNLVSSIKSETVFVTIVNTSGSTAMAGTYLYYDRLTVVGGSATFNLDLSSLIPGTYDISLSGQSIDFTDQFDINPPIVSKRTAQ